MENHNPKKLLLISGKRKSGKDFISEELVRLAEGNAVIIRISAPIKSHWAKINNLNFEELSGTGEYKEKYRKAMIDWSEEIRLKDYGYFCKAAVEMQQGCPKPVWIVSDMRRKTDLKWFRNNFQDKVRTLRVVADDEVRKSRGWVFTEGIDDVASECDLDDVTDWDWTIENNSGDIKACEETLQLIKNWIKS